MLRHVSRARARAIHRRGVGYREMGLLSIIKKCAERLRRVVVVAPLAPLRSFVDSPSERSLSRAGQGEGTRASRVDGGFR